MVQISKFPVLRHLRSEPNRHVLHWSRGSLQRSGRGLSYWFQPLTAAIAEVPCDDRELSFLVRGRSADFQEMTAQGVLTWRVTDPERVAKRIDFSIDLAEGHWVEKPLEQLADVLSEQVRQLALGALAQLDVKAHLERGIDVVREGVRSGLKGLEVLEELGVGVVATSIGEVAPCAELERALQTPALEAMQQKADEATFERRALAVQKERAIAENELQNRIELAAREADLIGQQGENTRKRATEEAEAGRISAEARAAQQQIAAEAQAAQQRVAADAQAQEERVKSAAQAEGIAAVEDARVVAERERIGIYRDLPVNVMLGLAAREFAGKLRHIEHLNLSPDLLSNMLGDLMQAGTQALSSRGERRP
ncbi:SPFH domain-containing protein [bacterium]|nr:SPFH domain-containing protein [bacterium]